MKIHQMLPNYSYGDAIGNCVTGMRDLLRGWGFESEVFADVIDDRLDARDYREFTIEGPDTWVVYHYSTGSPVNRFVLEYANRIILMYHNITPADFFEGYNEEAARNCREGRDLLKYFKGKTKAAMAVSPYNAEELESLGIGPISIVPCIVNFDEKQPTGKKPFDDGKTNILFVGRIAPQKMYEDLIKVFYFYKKHVDENSRLILAGGYSEEDKYYRRLKSLIEELKLTDVVFTGKVSNRELADHYVNASVFLCMSRHEGFCIPLLEAMKFKTPIVALKSSGVTGSMGGAGVLVDGTPHHEIAEILGLVKEDESLRQKMISAGLEQMEKFSNDKVAESFKAVIDNTAGNGAGASTP